MRRLKDHPIFRQSCLHDSHVRGCVHFEFSYFLPRSALQDDGACARCRDQ